MESKPENSQAEPKKVGEESKVEESVNELNVNKLAVEESSVKEEEKNITENISMEITPSKEVSFEDQVNFEKEVEARVEKQMEEDQKQESQEPVINLTIENLLNIKTIVEAAVQRNAFKQEEMKDVLGNYEFFVKGLQTLVKQQQNMNN